MENTDFENQPNLDVTRQSYGKSDAIMKRITANWDGDEELDAVQELALDIEWYIEEAIDALEYLCDAELSSREQVLSEMKRDQKNMISNLENRELACELQKLLLLDGYVSLFRNP